MQKVNSWSSVYFGGACLMISVLDDGLQQIMSNMITIRKTNTNRTGMWATAQRDGRPAKYRWRSPCRVWL